MSKLLDSTALQAYLRASLDELSSYASAPEAKRRLNTRLKAIGKLPAGIQKLLHVEEKASGIDWDSLDQTLGLDFKKIQDSEILNAEEKAFFSRPLHKQKCGETQNLD